MKVMERKVAMGLRRDGGEMERVERRGAEKKRVRRMRECEHDNDRVSERGSVNERPTERDESTWNTKGETLPPLSLRACISHSLRFSYFYTALSHLFIFLNLHLLISSLFCATSLPQPLLVLPSPISSAPRFPLLSFIPTSTPNIKTSKFEEPSFLLLSLTLK